MLHGMTIQERRCPRCTIRRTLRSSLGISFCFNCRFRWRSR
jgi:hypothetical protein